MKLTYTRQRDFLTPDLLPPEAPSIGKYGMMRRTYLMDNRPGLYTGMMISGKLMPHLEEIDQQANEMMTRLTQQMAKAEDLTETLKAQDQMLWVQRMNAIRSRAEEAVKSQLIYS